MLAAGECQTLESWPLDRSGFSAFVGSTTYQPADRPRLDRLVSVLGQTPHEVTRMLWDLHHPYILWWYMGGVGLLTTLALMGYGRWVYGYLERNPQD